jgi:hypothetical protein
MQLAVRTLVLGMGFCLALGGAQAASAISLLDLANGASFDSGDGNITFSDFSVNVRGRNANSDLSTYDVIVLSDGFLVDLGDATQGMLGLTYVASADAGLTGASLMLVGDPGESQATKLVRAVGSRGRMFGRANVGDIVFGGFGEASLVTVRERVRIRDAGLTSLGNAFSQDGAVPSFTALPEPASLILLAPLATLALRRRAHR